MSPDKSLSDDEIMLLDNLIYSDNVIDRPTKTVKDIVKSLIADADSKSENDQFPGMMDKKEWENILHDIDNDSTLSSLKVEHGQDDGAAGGIHAACFVDPNGKVYTIFRGTSGPSE